MGTKKNQTTADDTANIGLGRSSLVSFFAKIALALLGFIGVIFFYRELGASQYGIYYTALAVAKLGSQFQGGISTAIRKRVSEVNADQSAYLGLGVITFLLLTLISVVCIITLQLFTDQIILIFEYVGGESVARRLTTAPKYLIGAFGMAISLAAFGLINMFYVGIGNPGKGNWMDTLRSLLTLGGQVTLVIVGLNEFGLIGGFVAGTVATAAIAALKTSVRPTVPSWEIIQRTTSYAKWSLPLSLVSNLYSRFDIFLLTAVLGASASGVYAPALQLTTPAIFVASSIGSSLNIKSSGLSSQDQPVHTHLRNSMAFAGLIALPMFFGALAIPSALMRTIFGPTARAGATALVGLALFQIFKSYIQILSSVISGIDRPDLVLKIKVVTLLINIPVALVLVQSYGLFGVVLATVIAEAFLLLLHYVVIVHLLDQGPGVPREVVEQLFAAMVMFGGIEAVTTSGVLPIRGVVSLLFVVSLGAAIYFAVLFTVSPRFNNTVQTVFRETVPV